MKILLAADGSPYTKKALAFLATHEEIAGRDGEVVVINVQPVIPPQVKKMVGAASVNDYYREEAEKVLAPIERFLKRHGIPATSKWVVGSPGPEIVKAAQREKAHMILMGTHGQGLLSRALIGSIAQKVLTEAEIPVLLVK
jgi:nucleotide-binding universal stress UspA family protein